MVELLKAEWREAYQLVKVVFDSFTDNSSCDEVSRKEAFDFLCKAKSKKLLGIAHLLQPFCTERAVQAALANLERMDNHVKVTDVEMNIRSTDKPCKADKAKIIVIADNIRSTFNMGGIFRTADFFGIEKLILCGFSPTPENAQVKKTALGADESTPWEHVNDVRDAIDDLRKEGRRIYALETVDGASDIAKLDPILPCAIILGNERFGIDSDVVAMADEVVEIKSHGQKNSLNVVSAFSVAAAFFRK